MSIFWNSVKTTLFLGVLTGMFLLVGAALGGRTGMIIAGLFAVSINMAAWWWSDKLALRFGGAKPVSEAEQPDLHRMVDLLAQRAGIPKPAVYMVESDQPNAFATGRSPAKGAVAVTTGLQRMLTREELAGVVAHEIAHIKNRDTLISSVAASIAGAVSMIADMALWSMIFGGGDEEEGGGGIVALIVAPIAALLVQMAISRSREYVADATGARILGTPEPLVRALEKLEQGVARRPMHVNPATSHMYIVNPMMG
ncbi:MAG: zinc metalloprotease HtpX, partial [Caldilineaceae bacterium]